MNCETTRPDGPDPSTDEGFCYRGRHYWLSPLNGKLLATLWREGGPSAAGVPLDDFDVKVWGRPRLQGAISSTLVQLNRALAKQRLPLVAVIEDNTVRLLIRSTANCRRSRKRRHTSRSKQRQKGNSHEL